MLREVQSETTAAGVMKNLNKVYLAKSLANRLYIKRRLYSYSFLEDKSILEQLEDFCKSIDDLKAVDVKIGDEDKAILVLNALPDSFDQMRDAILYGRDKPITFAKESRSSKKKFKKKNKESKADVSGAKETRSCHWCKNPGHLKRDCYAWKK